MNDATLEAKHLGTHAVAFTRQLRENGFLTTPSQTQLFVTALGCIELLSPQAVFAASRATLVTRREDWARFDALFWKFWRDLGLGGMPGALLNQAPAAPKPQSTTGENREPNPQPNTAPPSPQEVKLLDRALTYSSEQTNKRKRFDSMNAHELEAAKRAMRGLQWRIEPRRSRRAKHARQGNNLELRRTLRAAFRTHGEALRLVRKTRKTKPRAIVVLADVSGSMERYARMLLHFLHAMTQHAKRGQKQRLETFAFGTRLTRITRQLEERDTDAAIREVGAHVNDWSGGTRIGASLHTFNLEHAKRVLGRGAVVLVISDGWDQGDPKALAQEMERLQKTCHRLIWLNPLIGTRDYRPETRALQAALPFVDDFLPVADLQALSDLAAHLGSLPARRNSRRSGVRAWPS